MYIIFLATQISYKNTTIYDMNTVSYNDILKIPFETC